MISNYFNSLRLISRMRWITVIPALILFLVSMYAYVIFVAEDHNKGVLLQSQSIALGLSSEVEIGVQSNDKVRLISLIKPIVDKRKAVFINILDSNNNLIATYGNQDKTSVMMQRVQLLAPEIENPFDDEGGGLDEVASSTTAIIGYIEVAIINKGFFAQRKINLFYMALSLFSVLIIGLFLADRFTKQITGSISNIIRISEENYGEDLFTIPYPTNENGEIGELFKSKEKERVIIKEMLDREISLRLKADSANLAKTYFLHLLSHEMNQPLTSAYGLIQLLHKKAVSETDIFYLDIIMANMDLNIRFLHDLLQLADIDSDRLEIINKPMDLCKTFKTMCEPFRLDAITKNLDFSCSVTSDSVLVNSDKHRIEQILSNLLSNAIKYTRNGSINARLSTFEKDNAIFVEISVEDTGIGIKHEDQTKIFDMFERLDVSDTREQQGKGVGLYVVKKTVRAFGGYIGVHSENGRGTRFTVNFELTKADAIKPLEITNENRTLDNLLVMVVDDFSDTNIAFQAILEFLNAKVILCSTGEEAIETSKNKRPDVIILDCQLPGMSGPDIARIIRREENESNARSSIIIGCSGAGGKMEDRCMDSGMDGFLPKPFTSIHQIVSTISNAKGAKWHNAKYFSKLE